MNVENKIETPARVNINEAARDAMIGAEDYAAGAKRLLERAHRNPALLDALLQPHEWHAALAAVRNATTSKRKAVWTAPTRAEKAEGAERVFLLAESIGEMLLDFPLPGGRALRLATKEDVNEAADFYRTKAVDMGHKARWLARIARKVPKGQTVGDALDNAALEKMQKETDNG